MKSMSMILVQRSCEHTRIALQSTGTVQRHDVAQGEGSAHPVMKICELVFLFMHHISTEVRAFLKKGTANQPDPSSFVGSARKIFTARFRLISRQK